MTEPDELEGKQHPLPFNRTITLSGVDYGGDIPMIRLTIREGRRFTTLDLDADSARALCRDISGWADRVSPPANTNQG